MQLNIDHHYFIATYLMYISHINVNPDQDRSFWGLFIDAGGQNRPFSLKYVNIYNNDELGTIIPHLKKIREI